MSEIIIHIDGSPGKPKENHGYLCVYINNECILKRIYPKPTSNQAEFLALIKALEILQQRNIREFKLFSDSKLLVNGINGQYSIQHDNIKYLNSMARDKLKDFFDYEIAWIGRKYNRAGYKLDHLRRPGKKPGCGEFEKKFHYKGDRRPDRLERTDWVPLKAFSKNKVF